MGEVTKLTLGLILTVCRVLLSERNDWFVKSSECTLSYVIATHRISLSSCPERIIYLKVLEMQLQKIPLKPLHFI